jgi:hypothetical protein
MGHPYSRAVVREYLQSENPRWRNGGVVRQGGQPRGNQVMTTR